MAYDIPPPSNPRRRPDRDQGPGSGGAGGAGGVGRPSRPALPEADLVRRLTAPGAGSALATARTPFAWQHGNRLLLLEARPLGWIIAEMRFDATKCSYVEISRTRYRWAREATGSLLSRALAAGDGAAERAARDLDAWLIRQ